MTNFDPRDHIVKVTSKQGKETQFINFRKATLWFHQDHPLPQGRIITVPVNSDPLTFRAEIYVGDSLVATAHASAEGERKSLSKVESAAIRRALANAGYDADHAVQRFAAGTSVEDKKKRLGSGGTRRVGQRQDSPPQSETQEGDDPVEGERRNFSIVKLQTRQSRSGKAYYAMSDSADVAIFAFSRDVFRALGYTDTQMKSWDKPNFSVQFREPLSIDAQWEIGDNGGYWKAQVPVPEGAENIDDWFPERNGSS